MATAETALRPHDRQKGRRPFAAWMKRLANLKNSSTSTPSADKKGPLSRTKRKPNNPYPESGYIRPAPTAPSTASGRASSFTPVSLASGGRVGSFGSYEDGSGGGGAIMRSNKSQAPTLATNPETIHSDTGFSRAGTTYTDGIYSGRANSTFSSPRASQESLTTTLTTIQSTAPSAMLPAPTATTTAGGGGGGQPTHSPVTFSHQYPVSPPASALPSHLQTQGQPNTFAAATAGNLLTDNASILTLASSSKRRRRNSLDTNASVRAIAPSSVWGNSRESLPLSVLSAIDPPGTSSATGASGGGGGGGPPRPSLSGLASAERASVYSNPGGIGGVGAPALVSERNSYYSTKQGNVDAVSVRSGHLGMAGHGRSESINGSISGVAASDRAADRAAGDRAATAATVATVATSPLASPVPEAYPPPSSAGWTSRRTSAWKENVEEEEETEGEEMAGGANEKVDAVQSKGKEKCAR